MTASPTVAGQQTFRVADAVQRGIALLRSGRLDEAQRFFLAVLQAFPAHVDARHFLGMLRFQQGRVQEALQLLQGVLLSHPSAAVLSNLGRMLHELGRFGEALEHLERAVALDPGSAEAHNNRGSTLRELGRAEHALESYCQALDKRPAWPAALHGKACALSDLGRWNDAESALRTCIAVAPDYALAQVSLGQALLQLGRMQEARSCARAALALAQQAGFPHRAFGELAARCSLAEPARQHLTAALAADPEDGQGTRLLLAALGSAPAPGRASDEFLARLYAKRAANWDTMMREGGYRGAHLVSDALARVVSRLDTLDVLDAGCGTGQVGTLVRGRCRQLEGVDLSPEMLARAAATGAYARLHESELVQFLRSHPRQYDAVTCAATLIHFGDLRPPLHAARIALRANGLLVFTVFSDEIASDGFRAGTFDGYAQGGCYSHGAKYVASTAEQSGFTLELLEHAVQEHHLGKPKMGLIVALRKA